MKIFSSEITPYFKYLNRRKYLKGSIAAAISLGTPSILKANHTKNVNTYDHLLDKDDELNKFEEITTYNNFYEFGMGKSDPSKYSLKFKPMPWTITLEGLVKKPQILDIEKLIKKVTIEDRIYRLRCVEAWSMVIPWQGFPLSNLIKIAEPQNSAKFI